MIASLLRIISQRRSTPKAMFSEMHLIMMSLLRMTSQR